MKEIFTVGHSSHDLKAFVGLLYLNGISAIGDVRSSPYSKYTPQYNREALIETLERQGIAYHYLGHLLGARPNDDEAYTAGRLDFEKVAKRDYFKKGLCIIREAAETKRLALMCSEKDPMQCHRMILVTRNLRSPDFKISHILDNGKIEANAETELRLKTLMRLPEADLFMSSENLIDEAYERQSKKIAFRPTTDNEEGNML